MTCASCAGDCGIHTNGTCICHKNQYGFYCDIYCDDATTCNNRGVCNTNGKCECNDAYLGANCDVSKLGLGIGFGVSGLIIIAIIVTIVVCKKRSRHIGYQPIQD